MASKHADIVSRARFAREARVREGMFKIPPWRGGRRIPGGGEARAGFSREVKGTI